MVSMLGQKSTYACLISLKEPFGFTTPKFDTNGVSINPISTPKDELQLDKRSTHPLNSCRLRSGILVTPGSKSGEPGNPLGRSIFSAGRVNVLGSVQIFTPRKLRQVSDKPSISLLTLFAAAGTKQKHIAYSQRDTPCRGRNPSQGSTKAPSATYWRAT